MEREAAVHGSGGSSAWNGRQQCMVRLPWWRHGKAREVSCKTSFHVIRASVTDRPQEVMPPQESFYDTRQHHGMARLVSCRASFHAIRGVSW